MKRVARAYTADVMRSRLRRAALVGMLLTTGPVAGLFGCQKALFPKDENRTQFDSHDYMRRGYTPLEEPDVFGNPQPALRLRLTQPE